MTQGFPPGQPEPPASSQGVYPPQGSYVASPQPPRANRVWAVALGLVGLCPEFFYLIINIIEVTFGEFFSYSEAIFITYWDSGIASWFFNRLIFDLVIISSVMTAFRSAVGRWILVITSSMFFIMGVLDLVHGTLRSEFVCALLVLVIAFLPPVNRAFRKVPQPAMAYGQPVPQQGGYPQQPPQPMQPQQQPPQQPGYGQPPQPQQPPQGYPQQPHPQQQWQQGPPR